MTLRRFGSFHIHPFLWGVLSMAGVVVCAATLVGFFGKYSWFLDLFAHFRVQYLFGLSLLGLLFAVARRHRMALLFAAVACINAGVVFPLYVGGSPRVTANDNVLRVMLINVNTALGDPARVRRVVQDVDPDVVVLEEISMQWVLDLLWLADSHPHSCIQPRSDNFGIGLYSKYPLTQSEVMTIGSAQVPSIVATVNVDPEALTIIATHPLPPRGADYSEGRNDQLECLTDHIRGESPLILVGDLNMTPWSYYFRRLLARSGLVDSSRGWGVQPSWSCFNPLMRIPIDHCLHTPDVSVVNRRIGEAVGSDHYPLIIDLAIGRARDPLEKGSLHEDAM